MFVSKQVKSRRKYGIAQKLLFETKEPYRVLEKATPISYWIKCLLFVEGIGSHRRKVKESAASMEKIPSTIVLYKYVDVADTIFATMARPLSTNYLEKWLGVIIRETYQASSEDIIEEYEPVYDLWTAIYPDHDSSDDGSIDE